MGKTLKICTNDLLHSFFIVIDTRPSNLVLLATTFFKQDKATAFTFDADIMVSGENIPAASAPNKNFKITMKFAEHSNGSDSLGLATMAATITPDSDREQALVSGIASAITLKGSTTMTLSSTHCNDVHYLCVHVDKGIGAVYLDAVTDNNYFCNNIDTRKSCNPSKQATDINKSLCRL